MLIWTFTGLIRLFQPQYRYHSVHCLVLLIPIFFLLTPHRPINTAGLLNHNKQNTKTQVSDWNSNKPVPATENAKTTAPAPEEETTLPQKEFSDVLPGLDEELKTITVSNNDFGFRPCVISAR